MNCVGVVYILNKTRGIAVATNPEARLPAKLPFETLATFVARGQAAWFKGERAEDEENIKRIVSLFKTKRHEQPTIAVVVAASFSDDKCDSLFPANSMGVLTIQRGQLDVMTGDAIASKRTTLWINEVCKSVLDESAPGDGWHTLIPTAMELAEEFARTKGESAIHLMVEKHPKCGDGQVLKEYYSVGYKSKGGYGYRVMAEDDEYWYMGKDIF